MREIRPIRADEAERFLALLCRVFGLDFHRAHRIFFSEPMFDLQRKWALFEHGEMLSILTTVPLEFGWGNGIGIAGVATREDRRGEGLAFQLLQRVMEDSAQRGEPGALLFARETTLYARAGFEVLDHVIRGRVRSVPEESMPPVLDYERVERVYDDWAARDPNRLRRDTRRWNYWRWNLRVCSVFGDGYLCHEAGLVRECVTNVPVKEWAIPPDSEWLGLTTVAEHLQVPLEDSQHDLYLMGRDISTPPQMFMTDQF